MCFLFHNFVVSSDNYMKNSQKRKLLLEVAVLDINFKFCLSSMLEDLAIRIRQKNDKHFPSCLSVLLKLFEGIFPCHKQKMFVMHMFV